MAHYYGKEETVKALDGFTKFLRAHSTYLKAFEKISPLPKGMTATQFGVLEALLHVGPLSQCQIAGKILKSTANLTTVIDNLERNALVLRRQDPRDRRNNIICLTDRGRKAIEELFPQRAEAITTLFSVFSKNELEVFSKLCKKLGLSIDEEYIRTPLKSPSLQEHG